MKYYTVHVTFDSLFQQVDEIFAKGGSLFTLHFDAATLALCDLVLDTLTRALRCSTYWLHKQNKDEHSTHNAWQKRNLYNTGTHFVQ